MEWNLMAAWIGFLLGGMAGAISGLFFRQENWLGGYGSWTRRLVRLGHISFFGIGFLNLLYYLTVRTTGLNLTSPWPGGLLLVGAATMPLVCYLSAGRPWFRHLFFIPAGSVITALLLVTLDILKIIPVHPVS